MKTNWNLNSSNKLKLKRKLEPESDEEAKEEELYDYIGYDSDSEKFEVADYDFQRFCKQPHAGGPVVSTLYDLSDPPQDQDLYDDSLIYLSKLAIAFYNIREGTSFCDVKLLLATEDGFLHSNNYITFQAFSSTSSRTRNGEVPVTFQTKIIIYHPNPRPKFKIVFVRIKPVHNKSKRRHPSKSVRKPDIYLQRLSQVIKTYTIDSQLDSQYGLALLLSQYALVSYYLHVLSEDVAKHDIESLKVLKLVKPVAEVPTYLITFGAPLHTETDRKSVEIFETEICMPTLFPTTTIDLKSEAQMVSA